MQLRNLFLIFMSVFAFAAHADEGDEMGNLDDVLVKAETFPVPGGRDRRVVLAVLEYGHKIGKPFVVEIRPLCKPEEADWKAVDPYESVSACEVMADTMRFNAKAQEVTIDVHMPNMQKYHKELPNNPDAEIECLTEVRKVSFSLREVCGSK